MENDEEIINMLFRVDTNKWMKISRPSF
jgi:hypothetical protein